MASSGGWFLFSLMLVIIFALSFTASLSVRCERGLGNCVNDELALSRHLKKRAMRSQNCRFSCLGRKREMDKKKPLNNPENENEKQAVDEIVDEILLRRLPIKREKAESSRPPCQRFSCGGKKRSAEPRDSVFGTTSEIISLRNRVRHAECGRFGGCKRNMIKETFSSLEELDDPETKHRRQQKQEADQEQDSRPSCFGFGCKKREPSGEEVSGLSIAPIEKTQEGAISAVDQDLDDTRKTQCGRFGCKRTNHLQTSVKKISKRLNKKPNEVQRFDPKKQEKKTQ